MMNTLNFNKSTFLSLAVFVALSFTSTNLNANTLAKRIDSISHEVLVNIGERVIRVYKDN